MGPHICHALAGWQMWGFFFFKQELDSVRGKINNQGKSNEKH